MHGGQPTRRTAAGYRDRGCGDHQILRGKLASQRACNIRRRRPTKPAAKLLGDAAYDSAALRQWLDERGTKPVVPNSANRLQPFRFNKRACKQRHRIENAFRRFEDFRRIFARCDRLARTFLASVCFAAASCLIVGCVNRAHGHGPSRSDLREGDSAGRGTCGSVWSGREHRWTSWRGRKAARGLTSAPHLG
ncbi:transposase [Reyranella sp.]|uniref:transposase n=1 Tax=Reyranella sp. TaxID=1929291 RepID=UPI0039C94ACD